MVERRQEGRRREANLKKKWERKERLAFFFLSFFFFMSVGLGLRLSPERLPQISGIFMGLADSAPVVVCRGSCNQVPQTWSSATIYFSRF